MHPLRHLNWIVPVFAGLLVTVWYFWTGRADQPPEPVATVQQATPQPAPAPENNSDLVINYPKRVDEGVQCAALIATMESSINGKLAPDSDAYRLVGYTLGKAEEDALRAGLSKGEVRQKYQEKIIAFYPQFMRNPKGTQEKLRSEHDNCVARAKHYDPQTMVGAALEEHQRQGQ